MSDKLWSEVVTFLRQDAGLLRDTIGPPGIKKLIPEIQVYSSNLDITRLKQVVFNKSAVGKAPLLALASGFGRARPVFSNSVFVVFQMVSSSDVHVKSFETALLNALVSMQQKTDEEGAPSRGEMSHLLRRPVVGKSPKKRVVAALQAPTLLNIWSLSSSWKLQWAELGDHASLQEASLLNAEPWGGGDEDVTAVLVTSPIQIKNAQRIFPKAAHIWILHNGQPRLIPSNITDSIDGYIVLSKKVLVVQQSQNPSLLRKPSWVIPPSYEAKRTYRWRKNTPWTMKSRFIDRNEYFKELFEQTSHMLAERNLHLTMYGQDTPGGFLNNEEKLSLYKRCSCYVTTLPPWSGFGLAEHECLAAGVPIAGLMWGDLETDLKGQYASLVANLDELVEQAQQLCIDKAYAAEISESGLQYIRDSRTRSSMDEAVSKFIAEVKKL